VIETVSAKTLTPWQLASRKDWCFDQIKFHYDVILGKMLQNSAQSPDDVEVPYLKAQHVQWDGVQMAELPTMWASPQEIKVLQVNDGDLIVCEGGEVGRAAIVAKQPPEKCIIQNALHLVRPKPTGEVRFLRYLLQHATSHAWLDVLCNRATIAHFTSEKFREMWIWLPPFSEQCAIADYLDRETAKLDTLIAAKQRLLDLLAEKRRALITHAVTRGLNPAAPLQDSGVEWLGEIPAHWEVTVMRRIITNIEQGWSPQADEREPQQGEWGVLKLNAVKGGQFDESKAKSLPNSLDIPTSLEIRSGDFLVTRANTPDLVGDVCYVSKTKPHLILSDLIYRLYLNFSFIDGDFLSFFLETAGRPQIEVDARGSSASMVKISQGHILNWLLPCPPLYEQQKISLYIKSEITKIDFLRIALKHTIELLYERRTALIAAAVTGKLRLKE